MVRIGKTRSGTTGRVLQARTVEAGTGTDESGMEMNRRQGLARQSRQGVARRGRAMLGAARQGWA